MRRVTIAIAAVAIVAAAILGFLLFGEDDQALEPVAEAERPAPESQQAAAPPPPPPAPVATESAAEPVTQPAAPGAATAPADTAAPAVAETAPQQPVIIIKPRSPAPEAPAAAPSAPPQVSVKMPSDAASGAPAPAEMASTAETADAAVPAAEKPAEAPSFDVVRVERSGETVIAGRAEPDSEVNVTTERGESLGRARVDSSGTWAIVTETPLTPGSHEIGVEAQGATGEKRLSEEVVVVVVPEPAKASAAPAAPQARTPETQVLAVLTPRQGAGATKVLPQEAEDGIAEGDLVLDSVDYDETGRVTIGGRASPGSRVLIYLDNRLIGDSVAGPEGRWSHTPEQPVAEGLHSLRVDQVDSNGAVLARVETPFSREAVRVPRADEEFVIVQPGNSLWRIARRTYGEGVRYTVIYQANKSQIRDPDLIYPGQVFELPGIN